ncbi:ABC transporter permease [Actinomyces sp. MRS3W]|uniref:ABC transporter permease n=1 Tax=Actinomyces sp. MRS3W TaxID=2800796 RepID=UPI0028FD51FE|nr:ABC transporter permease [Actinomyces sp. MRS3W]MDU0348144.1 ABC transporter permease [Actinomyces sp. MRS3W]
MPAPAIRHLDRIGAIARKGMRQWARDRQALVGPMLIPLVLMFLCGILFGFGGDEWNIGLVNEGGGAHAAAFETQVRELRGNISPYFRVVTTDADQARRLVDEGRLHLVVTIPEDFDERIDAGEIPVLYTRVYNINTDMMKNARLRLTRAVQDYAAANAPGQAPVTVTQTTTRVDDVPRRTFIAHSAVILAIMVGSALNAAIMVAREWERRTVKEIRLAPRPLTDLTTGMLLAAIAAGAINTLVTLMVAVGVFGVRIPVGRLPVLVAIAALVSIACAGVGIAVGAWLRDYRTIQPLLMITFAGSFFAAGGFSSVATLPRAVQAFDRFWPPAYVFESMQAQAWMTQPPSPGPILLGGAIAALVGVGAGVWALRRRL